MQTAGPFPEEVQVMELFKRALDALSAAVGVVVLMGFVAYERIVREDRGVDMQPAHGRTGLPGP